MNSQNRQHKLRHYCRIGDIDNVTKLLNEGISPCVIYKRMTCLDIVLNQIRLSNGEVYFDILQKLVVYSRMITLTPNQVYFGLTIAVNSRRENIVKYFLNYLHRIPDRSIVYLILQIIELKMSEDIIDKFIDAWLTLPDKYLDNIHIFKVIFTLSETMNECINKCLSRVRSIMDTGSAIWQYGIRFIQTEKSSLLVMKILDIVMDDKYFKTNKFLVNFVYRNSKSILNHLCNCQAPIDMIFKLSTVSNYLEMSEILSKRYGHFLLLRYEYNCDIILYILKALFAQCYYFNAVM